MRKTPTQGGHGSGEREVGFSGALLLKEFDGWVTRKFN